MQRLEVSDAVRPLYWSFGVKGLNTSAKTAAMADVGATWRRATRFPFWSQFRPIPIEGTTERPPKPMMGVKIMKRVNQPKACSHENQGPNAAHRCETRG